MVRVFDKNMFIMLISIMIGVIIITYFVADIQRRAQVESLESEKQVLRSEKLQIEEMSVNFTNSFLKSSVLLDLAREDRAAGNLPFDLASLKYSTALSILNETSLETYKEEIYIDCDDAINNYSISRLNFIASKAKFEETKGFTTYENYHTLLDSYIKLCESGSKLTFLRQNASTFLKYLAENLTIVDNNVTYETNVSFLLENYSITLGLYAEEAANYEEIYEKEIAEYDIIGFDPINR